MPAEVVPNVEAATADLLATLAGVSTSSTTATYYTTISQVAYWTSFGIHADYAQSVVADNGVLLEEEDIEPLGEGGQPQPNVFDYWQNYALTVFAMENEDTGYRARRRLQIMRGDIIKAIKTDIYRGQHAHDTLVTGWEFAATDDGIPCMVIRFKVFIRESALDPFANR